MKIFRLQSLRLAVISACVAAFAHAQTTVFEDTFSGGSSVNSSPTSPAQPSVNAAAYQQVAAKTFNPNPPTIAAGHFRQGIVGTTSGFNHVQALFTKYPVTLANTGDYIELTLTFTTESGIITAQTTSSLFFGLYNADQVQPIPGGLNGTGTTATAGYARSWIGYVNRIFYTGGANGFYTRPAKLDADANNQDVLYNYGGASGVGSTSTSTLAAFTAGAQYTEVYRITKASATTLTLASTLYAGASAMGTPLYTQSATSTSILTATYDAFATGYRATGSVVSVMDINAVKIVTNAATTIIPVFTTQPISQTKAVGEALTLSATANGGGAASVSYQWKKDGVDIAGATSDTFALASVTQADAGNYTVVATNTAGSTTSSTAILSVSVGAVAPAVLTQPVGAGIAVGGGHVFTVIANGTAPLVYNWEKSNDGTVFSAIGGDSSQLTISNATSADAGRYRVTITNAQGSTTSAVVNLVIAPVITAQPSPAVVAVNASTQISAAVDVGAGAPEATTFVWKRDGVTVADGSGISGATAATLQFSNFSTVNSGYYTVTASNSAGSVTSSQAYVGVPSTETVTFAPGNNAIGLAIDQQLRLTFQSPPILGTAGKLRIYDAANPATPVATIDASQFASYSPGNASATIPNAAIRSVQGASYYYMPLAVYGNEVCITISPTQRLSYGKTYFVNIEAGLILDSNHATFPAITDSTTWTFSTKASGPAAPTASTGLTSITIGQDGTGDFATFQGAFDWIPQNNTLPRTIHVLPGIYRDNASLAQNRNFVTIVGDGANRTDAQLIYPFAYFAPPNNVFTAGSLRIESSDVTVRNLTVDNIIYREYHPTGLPSSGASAAFAGAINTVATTGKRLVFDNVLMKGGQDTLFTVSGIAYFKNCEIWGSVDFIYGSALSVFEECAIVQIRSSGGPIGAPNTPLAQPYGLVFLNCSFPRALIANGYPYDVNVSSTTMMRPWGQDGAMAIINCNTGTHLSTKGWAEWDGRENTCRARELGTTLTDGSAAPTPAQRQTAGAYWLNTIDPDYTAGSMSPTDPLLVSPGGIINRQPVTVDPADYTLSAIFGHPYFALNGWLPSVLTTAPVFTTHPASQTINTGASATFTAAASGSPTYQWKKDNVDIPGATGASYTVSNATTASAGSYTVVATNVGGSTTSNAAVLTVNATTGPIIATQPSSQTVTVGTATSFTVAATGTGTLTYQWQKEIDGVFTNVPFLFAENDPSIVTDLSGITTPTLSFVHAQVINAGNYRVLVTDSTGTTPSNTVTFTVNAAPVGALTFDGFAASVTGGGTLTPVVVTTAAALKTAAEATAPAVITVSGVIDLGTNGRLSVKSNKTIRGADTGATIIGSLSLSTVTNVIVANLNITARTGARASNDGLTVGSGSTNVLITKCTFFDCTDGNLDVTNGSDNVTISWCKFYYTRNTTHNFSNLIGSSDTDVATSPYRVTWHHNWWGPGCKQRMLACRFGGAHMFNNYWSCTGNDYCSTSRNIAQLLSEYNVYNSVKDPLAKEGSATLKTIGNVFTNCTGTQTVSNDTVFTPPYTYRVDRTTDIPTLVSAGAGNVGTAAPAAESLTITGATSVATGGSLTLTASGYVSYQWRFNNEAILGATSATYTIANAQSANAGVYTVVGGFSGRADSVVSTPHTVTVTTGPVAVPPSITTQPASQTTTTGAATSFTVVASGDAPLTYQWQKDIAGTFTNISGATSATLTFASAQLSDAGSYRIIVTNGAGTATSSTATLTVNSANFAVTGPDGFADAATTGGGSLTPVVVTTAAALKTAAESTSPAVITVSGVLNLSSSGGNIRVKSNKTIQGADANATIIGNIFIGAGVENVILRGLNLTNPGTTLGTDGRYIDGGDGIGIDGGKNVFITHCTIFDCADGMIDTRLGADLVTISWCEFYYTVGQLDHRFTMISDGLLNRDPVTDAVISAGAPLRITMHHNWWSDRCDQRMPSSTNGHIHLYNNYWNTPGNSYAALARDMAQFLSEQNDYENVNSPLSRSDNNALLANGLIRAIGNRYTNVTGTTPDAGTDTVFTPPYSYKLQPTTSSSGLDVKTLVLAHAGNTAGLNSTSPTVLSATITSPSQTIPPGGSATLTAAFTGFTAASYQWRLNNFLITGATSASYALTAMEASKAGAYTVAITLATGETVVSAPFAVTLGTATAPTITTQPANVTVTAGASASFTVVATGNPTPTYQWRKAGVDIAGATAASYTIAATAASDAAQYTVVVTNSGGSVTSNAATLTVNTPPPSPPPASGGGGGGGAPSLWFIGALALLVAMRRALGRS